MAGDLPGDGGSGGAGPASSSSGPASSDGGIPQRPEILEYELGSGEVVLYESRQHHRNWVDCMRSREKPISDVEIGHRSASVCHLGNIAIKLGRKLRWSPDAEQFVGDAEATGMVRRQYRSLWSLPSQG